MMKTLNALFSITAKVNVVRRVPNNDRATVLFGWAGGKIEHVNKYSSLWEEDSTVISLASPLSIFRGPSESDISDVIHGSIMPELEGKRKVAFHIFSNGGLVYASRMFSVLGDRLDRVVFDSSPSLDMSVKTPATVVAEALNLPRLKPVFWWSTYLILSFLTTLFGSPNLHKFFGLDRMSDLQRGNKKLLFLFSSSDIITDSNMLKNYIGENFPGAQTHDFVDAPHVMLYPKYKVKYAELIQQFRQDESTTSSRS